MTRNDAEFAEAMREKCEIFCDGLTREQQQQKKRELLQQQAETFRLLVELACHLK